MVELSSKLSGYMSPTAKAAYAELSQAQQATFIEEFSKRRKSLAVAFVAWLLIGLHYAYLGRWGWQAALWLSAFAIVGVIWWIIDVFRVEGMVKAANQELSTQIITSVKALVK